MSCNIVHVQRQRERNVTVGPLEPWEWMTAVVAGNRTGRTATNSKKRLSRAHAAPLEGLGVDIHRRSLNNMGPLAEQEHDVDPGTLIYVDQ